MHLFYKSILMAAVSVVPVAVGAQTYPAPADLSESNYEFLSWSAEAAPETYPSNMVFHRSNESSPSLIIGDLAGDWHCGYNLSTRPRINGLGEGGISFVNTGSPQRDNCESGSTDLNIFMGGAVLAVNTVGVESAHIEFDAQALTVGDGTIPRQYALRLQYRIGPTGDFSDFETPVEFSTVGKVEGDEASFDVVLPAELLGVANLQFRWLYYDLNIEGAGGTRPSIRLDNIKVVNHDLEEVASPVLMTSVAELSGFVAALPGVSPVQSFELSGSAITEDITVTAPAGYTLSLTEDGAYTPVLTVAAEADILEPTEIFVRLTPVTGGNYTGNVEASSSGVITSVTVSGLAHESTDPAAAEIAAEDFEFLSWNSDAGVGVFPDHMALHTTSQASPDLIVTPLLRDWHCGYDLESRPRFNGMGDRGLSIINTGSAQYDDCTGGDNTMNVFMGGIVLGLNTVGVDSALIEYEVELLEEGDGDIKRQYAIRLQYRTNLSTDFTDFPEIVEFSSEDKTAGTAESVSFRLPVALLGKADAQVRWLYYDMKAEGAGGKRPQFRIDDIIVKKLTAPNSIHAVDGNGLIQVYPNPVVKGEFLRFSQPITGVLVDYTGRVITHFKDTKVLETEALVPGLYIIKTENGTTKISIR